MPNRSTQIPVFQWRQFAAEHRRTPNLIPYLSDVGAFEACAGRDERSRLIYVPIYVARDRTYQCALCAAEFDAEKSARQHVYDHHIRTTCVFEVKDWVDMQLQKDDNYIPKWMFLSSEERAEFDVALRRRDFALRRIARVHHANHIRSCI